MIFEAICIAPFNSWPDVGVVFLAKFHDRNGYRDFDLRDTTKPSGASIPYDMFFYHFYPIIKDERDEMSGTE